jgi:16S rRNA (guanine966-N2)-methyltransferase
VSARRPQTLRIIGGEWRSRLVEFAAGEGVRPTPDRVRQTLFDWLAPRIEGARCLDLFAGSGALGLEALSRGASRVCFVEKGRPQALAIDAALRKLAAGDRAEIRNTDGLAELSRLRGPWDVVFLDPPYASDLLARALPVLVPLLAPEARVYLEWPDRTRPAVPDGLEWARDKTAGGVSFGLLRYAPGAPA